MTCLLIGENVKPAQFRHPIFSMNLNGRTIHSILNKSDFSSYNPKTTKSPKVVATKIIVGISTINYNAVITPQDHCYQMISLKRKVNLKNKMNTYSSLDISDRSCVQRKAMKNMDASNAFIL